MAPSSPRRPAPSLAAALLGAALVTGCHSLPEVDWNPLIRVEHTVDGAVEIEALGPLIDIRDGPEGLSHAFRPFYQHKENYGLSVTDWLAPFGRNYETRDGDKWRFWPLLWSRNYRDNDGNPRWQGVLFPLFWSGRGADPADSYWAFWPVIGRTKDFFGVDQWDFFLWPLFMRTEMRVTEPSVSWTVLLLGGWTTGGPRDGSWRILPFYRRRLVRTPDGVLRTDLTSVLWPFFTWGYDYGDEGGGQRTGIWPFYSRVEGEGFYKTTVLWPFFRWNEETDPPPEDGGDYLYDMPFPIFRSARNDEREVFGIFPFWWHRKNDEVDSVNWMLLGYWRDTQSTTLEEGFPPRQYRREDRYFVPLWHHSRRYVQGRDGLDRQFQLWPFYHWDGSARGRRDTAFFSFMPLRNSEFFRPADELYSFLWTLWRYQSDGLRHETRLLFDTTMYRTGPEGVRISIPFLYSQRPERDGVLNQQVLWGLFSRRVDDEGLKSVSFLGIELWTR